MICSHITKINFTVFERGRFIMTTAMYDFMAPITGKCVPIDALHSDLLGDKVLGEGVSILPTENTVVAPCDGLISRVSESNRTVTFLDTEHNLEILMEANTDSEHASFDLHVRAGEAVKAGTALFSCNVTDIQARGGRVDVSCIVTNLPTKEVHVNCGDVVRGETCILSCECAC